MCSGTVAVGRKGMPQVLVLFDVTVVLHRVKKVYNCVY